MFVNVLCTVIHLLFWSKNHDTIFCIQLILREALDLTYHHIEFNAFDIDYLHSSLKQFYCIFPLLFFCDNSFLLNNFTAIF